MADRVKNSNFVFSSFCTAWRPAARAAAWILAVVFLAMGSAAKAEESLGSPTGHVLLTVSGNIAKTNRGKTAVFDLEMIRALGVKVIRTKTPWTDSVAEFEGVLLRDIMAAVGAKGASIHAVALNDYKVDIPAADYSSNNVIVAYKLNGHILRVRDKGPLWVIYPWDDVPALRSEMTYARSIWQMNRIRVQ